ncbi:hypothetical protein HZB05_01665 [Candidatus Wolfebacteria bacterium]|nr:hypothetical protein [Candidatus Wolfebacteria bacterium]
MAYKQSAIETELGRQEKLKTGWPWRLMFVAFLVFGSMVAIFLGITFGFQPYLKSQLSAVDTKLNQLVASISDEQQKSILNFYSQLSNIGGVLNSRSQATKYVNFLEKNVLKSVYFNSINLSFKERAATISADGQTLNYDSLAQQIEVFKEAPEIADVVLGNSRMTELGKAGSVVNFTVTLTFK